MDYATYLDQLLLDAADAQTGDKINLVNLSDLHQLLYQECPSTWLETAATELARMGYVVDWQDTNNHSVRITGAGLLRAAAIRKERAERTFLGKTLGFLTRDWIAITALLVSILALFKDGN